MPEDLKILTSRKAYEFSPDDLRLSMICTKPIQEHIQQMFQFQGTTIGSPMATFGDVPLTIPPGLVFNSGVWLSPDNTISSIRFLHFELQRIVIDMTGADSSLIDTIFESLIHSLSEIHAQDGSTLIGKPERILDYTEISARFSFPLDAIIAPPLRKLLYNSVRAGDKNQDVLLIPTLASGAFANKQKITSIPEASNFQTFTLAARIGTEIDKHIYYSGAPLASEAHIAYLQELEKALTPAS